MTSPILVVGGTGNVGPEVVRQLLNAGRDVRVLARDPGKATDLLGTDVEVVAGNLDDPASLVPALRRVEVASFATSMTPLLGKQEVSFIDAAEAAGVKRLVKLSASGLGVLTDVFRVGHAESEKRLQATGIPAVVLRPVVFMSNLLVQAAAIKTGKLPSVFGDGAVSHIDPRDVAEVMARALVDDGYHDEIWEIGGAEALTFDDVAAVFTDVLGRPVDHVRMDPADFAEAARRDGLPEFRVEAVLGAGRHAPQGRVRGIR